MAFWDHPVFVAKDVSLGCAPESGHEGTVNPIFRDVRDGTDKTGVVDRGGEMRDFLDWADRVDENLRERDVRIVYALYCEFCEFNDLAPMTEQMFSRHLMSLALANRACA